MNIGGDIAFMHGIMKHWFDMEKEQPGSALNHDFIQAHVNGLEALQAKVENHTWEQLEQSSGISKQRMIELATIIIQRSCGSSNTFLS